MRWLWLTGLDWTGLDLIGLGMIGLGLKFWLAEAVGEAAPLGDGVCSEIERDGGSRRETRAMGTANEGEEAFPARVDSWVQGTGVQGEEAFPARGDSSEEAAWRVLVSVRLVLVVALGVAQGNRGTNWPQ